MQNEKILVLDHGYVMLVESWGGDERVIEAARMSTNKGFLGWGPRCGICGGWFPDSDGEKCLTPDCEGHNRDRKFGDEKLLGYLYSHKHMTPFEMCGMTIEIQAPIFVFREWHRHRTQSYNEMSARYTQMPNLHYVPSVERIMNGGQDNKNKQGSSTLSTSPEEAESIRQRLSKTQQYIYNEYDALMKIYGLSKELARINTPVSRYSRMRASANLRNWLAFLTLRLDSAAQWEIRQYAQAVHKILGDLFPRTLGLFDGN